MRTQGEASLLFSLSSRQLWFLLEAGKKVGHDIAGATHEDEVVGGGVGQGRAVGFGDGGMEGAVETVGPSAGCHFLGREGPVGRGLRPVVGGVAGQELHDVGEVLVVHHAEDEAALAGRLGHDLGSQHLPSRHVVARVADGMGMAREWLPATHQSRGSADRAEALADALGVADRATGEELGDGREDGVGVARLVVATQVAQECAKGPRLILATLGRVVGRKDLGTVLGKEDRAPARVRLRLEDGARLGHGLAYDDRHVGLDDARLLVGYLGERVAEKLRVVHGDIRDDRELGRDDVRAVEASAQAHLDDRDVHFLLGKILEGQSRGEFEERGVERLEETTLLPHEIDHIVLGHHHAVDADALAEVHEVRTRVEAHPVAVGLEDGGEGVGRGALAVGARHVDGLVARVGMAEMGVEGVGVVQAVLVGRGAHVLEDGGAVEKIFYCLLVVHCCVLMRRTLLVDVRLSEAILMKTCRTVRLKRAESPTVLSPGHRPGYNGNQQDAL